MKKPPFAILVVALLFVMVDGEVGRADVGKESDRAMETNEGRKIVEYLKNVAESPGGVHLFGHESTINMGVAGDRDWVLETPEAFAASDLYALPSDVREMTGELPAIIGYDAFKLIVDVTDGAHRQEYVAASVASLRRYRESGGLVAFNWHMQPIGLPDYRERAYRMDEYENNPYIALMKETQPFYRIANGFATRDWWWSEFESKRLAPMAEKLQAISPDGSGLIMRPFHEFDGAWFWWGLEWLEGDEALNGRDALERVFVETARYFKERLPGLMIAFSSDKLDYVSHDGAEGEGEIAGRYRDEFVRFLPRKAEDRALIDIYGMDLYTNSESPWPTRDRFRIKLKGLSMLAADHGKVAAITEAGNRGTPAEDDGRQPCLDWYNDYLFEWVSDPEIQVAFALLWQNWSNNRNPEEEDPADGYFVPVFSEGPAGRDFVRYVEREQTLMLRDIEAR